MKHIKLLFAIIVAILFINMLNAQKKMSHTEGFLLGQSVILIENNYISDANNVKYMPYSIKIPFKEFAFLIYGKHLQISCFNYNELVRNGGQSFTGYFVDSLKQDSPLFDLQTMEYAVIKNGLAELNWLPVSAKPYIDTITSKGFNFVNTHVKSKNVDTIYYRKGYSLYVDSLNNGDSGTIQFRKRGGNPFLSIHFKKLSALESSPVLMYSMDRHDNNTSLEKFIQSALESYKGRDNSFYDDWPGNNYFSNNKFFPETKSAYFFRPRTDIPNDSAFEYRLVINNNNPVWRKSNNIIFVSGLEAGKKYQLEVRYKDKPQYVFREKFYVPGYWYQKLWFKIIAALSCFLFILTIYFFVKNKRQKKMRLMQKNQLKTLYSQLNPHFIFNALGSIQGLLNDGQIEKANLYLSGFGSLMRNTLSSSEKEFITLEDELNNIKDYVELEQLRRPFGFVTDIQKDINLHTIDMLPLLFQPVIENAIKHAAVNNDQLLHIFVSLKKDETSFEIKISDNGKGFNTDNQTSGKGLQLVQQRIDLFNRSFKKKKIIRQIESNEQGTSVTLTFVNWIENV